MSLTRYLVLISIAVSNRRGDALCPAAFTAHTHDAVNSPRLLESQCDHTSDMPCEDTWTQIAASAASNHDSEIFSDCGSLIQEYPCGSKIVPGTDWEVNKFCAKTCNVCATAAAAAEPDSDHHVYTATMAPFSPDSHYSVFTVEEDTVHIENTVPHGTDWFGFQMLQGPYDLASMTQYTFLLEPIQDENDENNKTTYTVGLALYSETKYYGPPPDSVRELINKSGQFIFACTMAVYEATGRGAFCNYDEVAEVGDVILVEGGSGGEIVSVFSVGVQASETDAMEIVSVSQDESNIHVSWKAKRTGPISSPTLELKYAAKPTAFDGHGLAAGNLVYHGTDYRICLPFGSLPVEDTQGLADDGLVDVYCGFGANVM